MTTDLLIAGVIADTFLSMVLFILLLYEMRRTKKLTASERAMYQKLYTATDRFQKFKMSVFQVIDTLQKQLAVSEKGWGEANDMLAYQKKENTSYLKLYRQLEAEHAALKDDYGLLQNKLNALTLKRQFDDDMPT